ncbi:N-acetylgalactosamine 6-sulfate sulfatase [Planctomycetales bacterium 10988]|nr:N-acetylgalactosamine 6-sulfate sulfatase [Planctomycetales bacterium 10988]
MQLRSPALWLLFLATSLFGIASNGQAEKNKQPNLIILLADDLGWTGLRSFGSDFYETPQLDAFVESGMKFTDAYAACTVCSPTRASIMTGKYPARLNLTDFISGQNRPWAKLQIPDWTKGLEKKYVTMPEALKTAGYQTWHIGKWHLDFPQDRNSGDPGTGPKAHGFDLTVNRPRGTRGYFVNKPEDPDFQYLTEAYTEEAVKLINNGKDKPFFLYMAYQVPHTPIQGRPDLVEYFKKKVDPNATHHNPEYAAMVASLDQSVGAILEQLDESGIADNTIVVFVSDNGGLTERYKVHDDFTENLPLRRGKGSAYEGGVRVPMAVRWPGVTKPGSVCDEPVMTIDFYPTFMEAAKVSSENQAQDPIDGVSLLPLLKKPKATIDRNLYWHHPHYHAGGGDDGPYTAVRSGRWRLIEFHEGNRIELYDLKKDIGETKNLASEMPEKVEALHQQLVDWRESVSAQMPTPNPNYNPAKAMQVKARR